MDRYLFIGMSTFLFSILVLFIAVVYQSYENYQIKKFKNDYYYKGKIDVHHSEMINIYSLNLTLNNIYETETGRFKFISKNEYLFKVKTELTKKLYFSELYRGVIKIENSKLILIGRIPFAPYIMLIFTILGCIIIGLTIFFITNSFIALYPLLLIALILMLFIHSYKNEKKYFLNAYNEIKNMIK